MTTEHRIPLPSGQSIWARLVPGGPGLPVIVVHGGPGCGHDYLEDLAALASERPVVLYDQLGCGRSNRAPDLTAYTMAACCNEIDAIAAHLGLDRFHLLAHSFGGWVAIEWMLRQPAGLASAVLYSTCASVPASQALMPGLVAALGPEHMASVERAMATGDQADPGYRAALRAFAKAYLCRLSPLPDCLRRSNANVAASPTYDHLFGPNEFTADGTLKDWDRTDRLHEIAVPILITVGRHDELAPSLSEDMLARLPDADLVLFERSAHYAHLEEPERFLQVVRRFIDRHD